MRFHNQWSMPWHQRTSCHVTAGHHSHLPVTNPLDFITLRFMWRIAVTLYINRKRINVVLNNKYGRISSVKIRLSPGTKKTTGRFQSFKFSRKIPGKFMFTGANIDVKAMAQKAKNGRRYFIKVEITCIVFFVFY